MDSDKKLPALLAILRGIHPHEVSAHANVLFDAGFTALEVPCNSPQWEQSIAILVQEWSKNKQRNMLIGAGTVLLPETATTVAKLGADFIVTPNTDGQVIQTAKNFGLLTCIGCLTPTEALSALKFGADVLKIFPSGTLGAEYIRQLAAVLPKNQPIFAVGGLTPANLASFFTAGCSGVGLGGDLYKAGQSITETAQKAKNFITAYKSYRSAQNV